MLTVGVAMMNAGRTKKTTARKRDLSCMATVSTVELKGWGEVGRGKSGWGGKGKRDGKKILCIYLKRRARLMSHLARGAYSAKVHSVTTERPRTGERGMTLTTQSNPRDSGSIMKSCSKRKKDVRCPSQRSMPATPTDPSQVEPPSCIAPENEVVASISPWSSDLKRSDDETVES